MRKFKILWIDDDWSEDQGLQFDYLSNIKRKIETSNPDVCITTRDSIAEGVLAFVVPQKSFDFLIVDLDFKNENEKKTGARNSYYNIIENVIARGIKFAIYTNQRDAFDLEDLVNDGGHLLLGIYDKSKPEEFVHDIVNFSQFSPFRIVHLSDFHYDSSLQGNYEKDQDNRFSKLIETLSEQNNSKKIDAIVFSGDFASHHPANDYVGCSPIIRDIVKSTTDDFSKLLIVPGNHDIEWDDFENSVLSPTPGKSFLELYKRVYDNNRDAISQLIGYNHFNGVFDEHYSPDSFCWNKKLLQGRLNILGLNSVETQKELKGKGKISDKTIAFINKTWSGNANQNEIRIAVFHHNVLPPFSINKLEESESLLNSGEIIDLLANKGCDLLLGGHCHDSYLYKFSYSVLKHRGFSEMRELTYISSGTTNGYSQQNDRARGINIIDIYPTKNLNGKNLVLTPLIYDSRENKWIKEAEINTNL